MLVFFRLSVVALSDPIDVYGNTWPPYVTSPGSDPGMTTQIVQEILRTAGKEPQFRYLQYSLIYKLLKSGDIPAAYPYFKTPLREQEVYFSKAPLHDVENRIYYNHYKNGPSVWADIKGSPGSLRGVDGYAYGEKYIGPLLDKTNVFKSEVLALRALIENEITYLPMTRRVMEHLLQQYFPEHTYKIRALTFEDGSVVSETTPLYVIFPRTAAGNALKNEFDAAREKLNSEGGFKAVNKSRPEYNSFFVTLEATDSVPFITGQDVENENDTHRKIYAIPSGSRGVVLEWSESILKPGQSESVYPVMMDQSLVRLVSGPHAGKELWIKNIHLEID